MRASEILSKAADLIEPEGCWIQRNFADGHGFCAYAAIGQVAGDEAHLEKAQCYDAIYRVIGPKYISQSIGQWNDEDGRTQAEIVAALREASQLVASKEAA